MSITIPSSPRRRRTRAQWQRVLAAQETSGLSQQAFCARHHIAYSSFCRWKREFSRLEPPTSPAFIELTPAAPATRTDWDVELELGEGVYLRLRRS